MKIHFGQNQLVLELSSSAFAWFHGHTQRMSLLQVIGGHYHRGATARAKAPTVSDLGANAHFAHRAINTILPPWTRIRALIVTPLTF